MTHSSFLMRAVLRRSVDLARRGLMLMSFAVGLSCGDKPTQPRLYERYLLEITSPNGPEGSAMLELTGSISAVSTSAGRVFQHTTGDVTRVVLILTDAGVLRLSVDLTDAAAAPTARIEQIGSPDDVLRSDVSGYAVTFRGIQ